MPARAKKGHNPRARPERSPGTVASQRELAEALQVSARTVEGWRKIGMPREPDGSYSVAAVLAWKQARDDELVARKKARLAERGAAGEDVDPSKLNLVERNLYFDARLKEEKLQAFRAKSMPIPHVQQLLRDRAAFLRKELLAVPRRLAPRCEGKRQSEIRTLIAAALERVLEGYAADVGGQK